MTGAAEFILPEVGNVSVQTIKRGRVLYRAHNHEHGAVWFGPSPGEEPKYRYDSHDGSYRVCYVGLSERAAFVEGVLHKAVPRRTISRKKLAERMISEIRVVTDIRAVRLYGEHLIPLGATATVAHGEPYKAVSWPWSRALFDHPTQVDGIVYKCRHDDSQYALVLFDRSEKKIEAGEGRRLSGTDLFSLRLLNTYDLGLES